ncbi:MAG TPA: sugar phosphate isomerase/epimerase family protein [Bryobacteraceae bacterium]|jgi:D-psicose/D-tagatose/L-ribulose 3-epimerase|nr:sugar phosphate isomerase/epimerase family protein [Bryobacteraceae bacterium]
MKFGINTFLWSAHFGPADFGLLPQIKEHGFDGIEATLIRPDDFAADAIRRALDENQLGCTVCSVLPPELSLITDDAATRKKTVAHLSDCIKQTAEAGAKVIAGPLYSPVGFLPGRRRTTQEWNSAVEGYQQLGPVLKSYSVDLCIEPLNRFETFFLNTTADAVALCDAVGDPAVGILWDTFHANVEEKNLAAALRLGGAHIKHVHTCENDRGIPGTGHVDWPAVFQALANIGYDGWLTIESFGFAIGDLAAAASIWRDLAADPDQIAWQGGPFLKSQLEATRRPA